jgi:hypothetical protein
LVIAEVEDELIHAYDSSDGSTPTGSRHRANVGRITRDSVGVAERNES